ncbi:hypothetical protein BH23THE1_BH23THE1_26810 [soil metagenome]
MAQKWNVQNMKRYLKIHVAVNIKTREILALEVTDEKVHDGRMLKKLVDQVSTSSSDKKNNKTIIIKAVLADGVFDTNRNFRYLEEKRIKPGIKVRKNSIVSSTSNNRLRNKEVMMLLQTNDLLKWKTRKKYGHRWIAPETVFSTMKRTFGEHVSAT